MPRKSILNNVELRLSKTDKVISYFTSRKRNHFGSESQLYETLETCIRHINYNFTVHLTTYPRIAVHVECGDSQQLKSKEDELSTAIQAALESRLKQT